MKLKKITLQELNTKFKKYLNGRSIIWDNTNQEINLTDEEIYFIGFWIQKKYYKPDETSVVNPISRRCFVDFIGYDNEKYRDVIIGRWKTTKGKFSEGK